MNREAEEEAQAKVDIWKYVFGFVDMAVVKCAIELGIPDAIESHGSSISLSQLSSILHCPPSPLHRILRYLAHRQILKEEHSAAAGQDGAATLYAQTPISRLMRRRGGENSMAAFILMESSPPMLAPWQALSARVLACGEAAAPFVATHGEDVWSYSSANLAHSELINGAMADDARVAVPAIIEGCPELLKGIGRLVDVGGGDGTALSLMVKAWPWIRGINFDLPHVVAVAPEVDGVEHIGGDMFECVPKADSAFIMWVLHDWGDDECIQILKRCKEAIPKDKGKVIIVDAVIEEGKEDKLTYVRLMLDMVMMAHTKNGKERSLEEWDYVLKEAGFSRYTVKPIQAVQSLIEAYP